MKVVLFDGVCNLCESSVQFIIARDTKSVFKFAPLGEASDSIVLMDADKIYRRSTAALRIAKELKAPYNLLYACIIVPRPLRDAVYNFIAKNRYKWFGQKTECWLPTPDLKARFLAHDPRFSDANQ